MLCIVFNLWQDEGGNPLPELCAKAVEDFLEELGLSTGFEDELSLDELPRPLEPLEVLRLLPR